MVPELLAMINLPEGMEKPCRLQAPKLTIRQRQGRLFEKTGPKRLGIMAPRAGRFCPITLGCIP